MAVKFKVVQRAKPGEEKENGKYYAQATISGEVTLDTLARRIAKTSMAARGDVLGVLTSLVDEIIESLEEGNTVRLGELGCVRIGLSSEGSEHPEDVSANNVRKGRIIYTPSVLLKDRVARISFRALSAGNKQTTAPTPDDRPEIE